jgi:hypothetical protein
MLVPGVSQRRKLPVVERCEVDASHLGAKRRAGWNNFKRTDGRVARNLAFDIHFNRPPASSMSSGYPLEDNYGKPITDCQPNPPALAVNPVRSHRPPAG